MNRQQRAQLRDLDRFAAAEDPGLDRTLRGGMPSGDRRRRAIWCLAGGATLFFVSLLAALPFCALMGLAVAAGGAYLFTRAEGSGPDFSAIFGREVRPKSGS